MKCLNVGHLVRVICSETQMDSWPWCVSVRVRAGVSTMARSCSHCNWQVVCVTAEVKWHHWHERSRCKWHRTCGKVPEHSAQTSRTKYSQGIHGFSSCLRRFCNDNSEFLSFHSFMGFCRKRGRDTTNSLSLPDLRQMCDAFGLMLLLCSRLNDVTAGYRSFPEHAIAITDAISHLRSSVLW